MWFIYKLYICTTLLKYQKYMKTWLQTEIWNDEIKGTGALKLFFSWHNGLSYVCSTMDTTGLDNHKRWVSTKKYQLAINLCHSEVLWEIDMG